PRRPPDHLPEPDRPDTGRVRPPAGRLRAGLPPPPGRGRPHPPGRPPPPPRPRGRRPLRPRPARPPAADPGVAEGLPHLRTARPALRPAQAQRPAQRPRRAGGPGTARRLPAR